MFTLMRAGVATVLLLVAGFVKAQTTDAVCSADYNWAISDIGHNPCLVAAYLMKPCNAFGANKVPALPSFGQTYVQPGSSGLGANSCTCSTVTYAAVQACALCQGGTGLKWSVWSAACDASAVSINEYPPALETSERSHIPSWMFGDVVMGDAFDVRRAQVLAEAEATPKSEGSIPVPLGNATKKKSKTIPLGAIVAACIGSIAFVFICAIVATFLIRLRRQRMGEQRLREGQSSASQWASSIGKPIRQSSSPPATGSSFGHRGPAPTPSSTGRNGWPTDAEKGPVPPLPPPKPAASAPRPDVRLAAPVLRLVNPPARSGASSPASQRPAPSRGHTTVSESVYSTSPSTPNGSPSAKLAIAGPPPRAPYDPEDPRTWKPSPPPPAKLQRGLPTSDAALERISPINAPGSSRMFPSAALGPSSPSTLVLSPTSSNGRRPSDTSTSTSSPAPRPVIPRQQPQPIDDSPPVRVGLPVTPRQQRAQRVKSRSDRREEGQARYPTPNSSPAPMPLPARQPIAPTLTVQSASPTPGASAPSRSALGVAGSGMRAPGLPGSPSPVTAPRTPLQQVPRSPLPPMSPPADTNEAYGGMAPDSDDEERIRAPVHPFATTSSSTSSLPQMGHARRPSPPDVVVPQSRFASRVANGTGSIRPGHSPQSSISSAAPTPFSASSTAPLMPRRPARYETHSPSPSQIVSPTYSTVTSASSGSANTSRRMLMADSRYPAMPPPTASSSATFGHGPSSSLDRGLRAPSPLSSLGRHAHSASVDSIVVPPRGRQREAPKPITPLIQARFAPRPGSPTSTAGASLPGSADTSATTFAARYADFGPYRDVSPAPPVPAVRMPARYESPSRTMASGPGPARPATNPSAWGAPPSTITASAPPVGNRLTVTQRPEGPRRMRA